MSLKTPSSHYHARILNLEKTIEGSLTSTSNITFNSLETSRKPQNNNSCKFNNSNESNHFPSFDSGSCYISSPVTPHLKSNVKDNLQRLDEDPSKGTSYSSHEPHSSEDYIEPSNSKTLSFIHPETPPREINPFDLSTPRKVKHRKKKTNTVTPLSSSYDDSSFSFCKLNKNISERETPPQVEASNLIASSLLESCFSFDSETSDELCILEKGIPPSEKEVKTSSNSISRNLVSTSPRSKKRKSKISTLTSALIATNLVSNVKTSTSFRPKRRPAKAPDCKKTFPPLNKREPTFAQPSSSSLEPSSNLIPNFESSFTFHLNSSEFPKSLILSSEETQDDSQELQKGHL